MSAPPASQRHDTHPMFVRLSGRKPPSCKLFQGFGLRFSRQGQALRAALPTLTAASQTAPFCCTTTLSPCQVPHKTTRSRLNSCPRFMEKLWFRASRRRAGVEVTPPQQKKSIRCWRRFFRLAQTYQMVWLQVALCLPTDRIPTTPPSGPPACKQIRAQVGGLDFVG